MSYRGTGVHPYAQSYRDDDMSDGYTYGGDDDDAYTAQSSVRSGRSNYSRRLHQPLHVHGNGSGSGHTPLGAKPPQHDFEAFSSDAEKLSAILKCADVERHKHHLSVSYHRFRKLLLLLPLLSCLYFLTDDDYRRHDDVHVVVPTNNDDQDDGTLSVPLAPLFPRHHLAFATALSRHPPSLRVFRLFFEAVVLLACASFALRCWENGDDDDDDDVGVCELYSERYGQTPEWGYTGVADEEMTRHILCCRRHPLLEDGSDGGETQQTDQVGQEEEEEEEEEG
mmetsp:Transcript_9661/g.20559  ORF Transcript_9661/g.20559 Transcript_9661/m.20559 type:complete len:281 (+) Transcript_9661:145-987(+)